MWKSHTIPVKALGDLKTLTVVTLSYIIYKAVAKTYVFPAFAFEIVILKVFLQSCSENITKKSRYYRHKPSED